MSDWPLFLFLGEFGVRAGLIAFVLLRRPLRHSSAATWAVLIAAVPVGGVALYLFLGHNRLGSKRRREYADIRARTRGLSSSLDETHPPPEIPPGLESIAMLAELVGGAAPREGNELELYTDADEWVDQLVRDIDAAEHHCHLLYYIFLLDESGIAVADALERAAGRGVACRVLVDAVGARAFLASRLAARLSAAGVHVAAALPVRFPRALLSRFDLRNHRKIAVVDGHTAHSGSHNLADESFAPKPKYAPWVDATVRLRGPAARDLQEIFVVDWYSETGESLDGLLSRSPAPRPGGVPAQVIATGPGAQNEAMPLLIQASLQLAREEVVLTTPYFVPDEATVAALCTAARRGVRSTLVVPALNDSRLVHLASRSYYDKLLAANVQIHEYMGGLLHAKTISVDGEFSFVSSANIDRRSFELNFEVSLAVFDHAFADRLSAVHAEYLEQSRRVEPDDWNDRDRIQRLFQNAAGMLAPVL